MKHHPEQQEDEIYMGNVTCPWETVQKTTWRSNRFGEHAQNVHGKPVPGLFPWFIKRSEVQAAYDEAQLSTGPNAAERAQVYKGMLDRSD